MPVNNGSGTQLMGFGTAGAYLIKKEPAATLPNIATSGTSPAMQTNFMAHWDQNPTLWQNPTAGHTGAVIQPHTILALPIYIF